MAQPKTKKRMVEQLNLERRRLEKNLTGLSERDLLVNGVIGEWSIKDVLAHLADWEAHMSVWLDAARCGQLVDEIEQGLNWKQFEEFNQRIYLRHKDQSLEDVLAYFHEIHRKFMRMVEAMPEDEMLKPGRYAFIGKGAVYSWLNAYANHDKWAKTHLIKWEKLNKENLP
jgi:hypothetical protein